MGNKKFKKGKGFTLIEMLVSITLFAFVITLSLTALMSVIRTNNATKMKKLVINNLNMAMESMSRDIRVGYNYTCGYSSYQDGGVNCTYGDDKFSFKTKDGINATFYYDPINKSIKRRIAGIENNDVILIGGNAPGELNIEKLRFFVRGAGRGDGLQPSVFIVLNGKINRSNFSSQFNLQTLISQRRLEI